MVSRLSLILIAVLILSFSGFVLLSSNAGISLFLLLVFFIALIALFVKFAIRSSKKRKEKQQKALKKAKNSQSNSSGGLIPKSNLPTEYKILAGILAFVNLLVILFEYIKALGQTPSAIGITGISGFLILYAAYFYIFEEYKKKTISSLGVLGNTLLLFLGSWPALILYFIFLYLVDRYDHSSSNKTVVRISLGIIGLVIATLITYYIFSLI